MFARGNSKSVEVLTRSLEEFKEVSGLVPSIAKSTVYFSNVSDDVKTNILSIMPFVEGKLRFVILACL